MNAPLALAVPALALAALATVVLPALRPPHVTAKRTPPAQARRDLAYNARVHRALAAFRAGDPSMEAEARAVIADLPPSDFRRVGFAAEFARRGKARAAYELARPYAHFAEFSLPNDREMATYADVATRAGHPEEAAWARERMGEDGHFRVWKRGEEYIFAPNRRGSAFPTGRGSYQNSVNMHMDDGLQFYPRFRDQIESLRQELLAAP